ncbi:hypothetical protein HDU91_006053 [Kappamyces sp. JEL0680]|nr:hypothetical protein HDU91_006053 [Kappamyces sp. JEL0680]
MSVERAAERAEIIDTCDGLKLSKELEQMLNTTTEVLGAGLASDIDGVIGSSTTQGSINHTLARCTCVTAPHDCAGKADEHKLDLHTAEGTGYGRLLLLGEKLCFAHHSNMVLECRKASRPTGLVHDTSRTSSISASKSLRSVFSTPTLRSGVSVASIASSTSLPCTITSIEKASVLSAMGPSSVSCVASVLPITASKPTLFPSLSISSFSWLRTALRSKLAKKSIESLSHTSTFSASFISDRTGQLGCGSGWDTLTQKSSVSLYAKDPHPRPLLRGSFTWPGEPASQYDLIQPMPNFGKTKASKHSRPFSFRLLCDRNTGQVRVYAGHLDSKGCLDLDETSVKWTTLSGRIDGFPAEPVLVWTPSLSRWSRLSVLGRGFPLESSHTEFQDNPLPQFDNLLTDGCLIYTSGTTLLWKSGEKIKDFEAGLVEFLNSKMCPITLDAIPCSQVMEPLERCSCPSTPRQLLSPLSWTLFKKMARRKRKEKFKERPWYFSGCG